MRKRSVQTLSAILLLFISACSELAPAPTHASPEGGVASPTLPPIPTYTPVTPIPTEDLQDLKQESQDSLLPKIGSIPMAEIPEENTDISFYQISMRACLETESPNMSCNDESDLPLANITSNLSDEGGASMDLTTGESGWVEVKWPHDWVFKDKDKPNTTSTTITEPQPEITITMPDGEIQNVCLGGHTGDGNLFGGNVDWTYSKEACNAIQIPEVHAMARGRRL